MRDDDQIAHYVRTIRDGLKAFCTTCDRERPVFVGVTTTGNTLTCCCFCARVLKRERAA